MDVSWRSQVLANQFTEVALKKKFMCIGYLIGFMNMLRFRAGSLWLHGGIRSPMVVSKVAYWSQEQQGGRRIAAAVLVGYIGDYKS